MADAVTTVDRTLAADDIVYLGTGFIGGPGDPDIVDFVGYGNVTDHEGSGPAPNPPSAGSIERKAIAASTSASMASGGAHHLWGNGEDADNNSADFVTKATPDPQNSLSSTEDSISTQNH